MAGVRARAIVTHLVVGSVVAWVLTGLLTACIHLFGDRGWGEALQLGCLFMTLLMLGYGAVGLGGGVVPIPSEVFRTFASERRTRVEDDPGALTPLGLALFVIPQLVLFAALFD